MDYISSTPYSLSINLKYCILAFNTLLNRLIHIHHREYFKIDMKGFHVGPNQNIWFWFKTTCRGKVDYGRCRRY